MKKIGQLTIAALAITVAFTACKKDYTCACNVKVEGYTEGDSTGSITVEAQDTTFNYAYADLSKKDAKSMCDGSEQTLSTEYKEFFGDHATVGCDLK